MIDSDLLLPLASSTLLTFRDFPPCQSEEFVTTERELCQLMHTQTVRKGQLWKGTPKVDGWYRTSIMEECSGATRRIRRRCFQPNEGLQLYCRGSRAGN